MFGMATVINSRYEYMHLPEEERVPGKVFFLLDENRFLVNDHLIMSKKDLERHNCLHCGAPNQSGICEYCGSVI